MQGDNALRSTSPFHQGGNMERTTGVHACCYQKDVPPSKIFNRFEKSKYLFYQVYSLQEKKTNCSPNCTLDFYHNSYFAIFNYAKAPSSLIKIVAAIILLNIYILKIFINTGDKYNIFQMSCDKG